MAPVVTLKLRVRHNVYVVYIVAFIDSVFPKSQAKFLADNQLDAVAWRQDDEGRRSGKPARGTRVCAISRALGAETRVCHAYQPGGLPRKTTGLAKPVLGNWPTVYCNNSR